MIGVHNLRKGVTFELDGELYRVIDFHHHKPGRGTAVIRTRLRNLRTGATIDRTFTSGGKVQDVRLDHATVQYLYNDGQMYYFMDSETFEQVALPASVLGDMVDYLVDGINVELETYNNEPISIELPTTVDMKVVKTDPGWAGDTAQNATKECIVETGLKVQVPLFVNENDIIRVDSRTGTYVTRV